MVCVGDSVFMNADASSLLKFCGRPQWGGGLRLKWIHVPLLNGERI